MKIVPIFEPHLYSFQFDEEGDEFNELMKLWTDAEYLEHYFSSNNELLNFKNISLQEAIVQTIKYTDELYDTLSQDGCNLDELFEPLTSADGKLNLPKQKLKRRKQEWLRIYAVKIESKYYVITGGAIKQSQSMDGHPDTLKELTKLEQCRNFLIQEGIVDIEGFLELIL